MGWDEMRWVVVLVLVLEERRGKGGRLNRAATCRVLSVLGTSGIAWYRMVWYAICNAMVWYGMVWEASVLKQETAGPQRGLHPPTHPPTYYLY